MENGTYQYVTPKEQEHLSMLSGKVFNLSAHERYSNYQAPLIKTFPISLIKITADQSVPN